MPRPNKPRAVTHEVTLARRIQFEREARNLTFDRLAEKMTEAGCPMQGSAIYKIENGSPRRRITLDEAVTFAQVFGMKLSALLIPADVAASREALALWKKYQEASSQERRWAEEGRRLGARLVELVDGNEAVLEALRDEDDHAELFISAEGAIARGQRMIDESEES